MAKKSYVTRDILFYFCMVWTIVYLAMILGEFFLDKSYQVTPAMKTIYLAFLGGYAANKETIRWTKKTEEIKRRRGEIFVYIWGLVILIMFIISYFSQNIFQVPTEAGKACVGVVAIFIGTETSKIIREKILSNLE